VIVDDLISTGGTMIALIEAIEQAGARINDVVCVAEKVEYDGRERIRDETGHDVKCLLRLSISGETCQVL
jgi:adenine/guanine phosphoribosyltransferase-like PRPP-binding protein